MTGTARPSHWSGSTTSSSRRRHAEGAEIYSEVLGCQHGYSYPKIGMEQLCGSAPIVLFDITHPGAAKAIRRSRAAATSITSASRPPFDHDAMLAHLEAHNVTLESVAFHGGSRGMGHAFNILDPSATSSKLKGPPVYPDGREQVAGTDR